MKSAGGGWGVGRHCNEEVLFCGSGIVYKKCVKMVPYISTPVLSFLSVVYKQDRQRTMT